MPNGASDPKNKKRAKKQAKAPAKAGTAAASGGGRPVCLRCGTAMPAIGLARANGVRRHGDWASRGYHKKCWKAMMKMRLYGM